MFLFRRTIEKFFQRTTKQESEDQSSPLTTEQVLREEASAILGRDPGDANSENPPKFYRNLNEFGFTALCLSGGGIRSAAFSLGVIQALAAHPRAPTGDTVGRAEDSLLSEFHYLSTVSGGGYIGSWLSAWCARDSFANVWRNLVGRPAGFDIEPSPISWLRSYSSYLTPKLGFLSADSWAIVAIYIQNLLLNWLIILPFLAGLILGVKLIAVVLVAATLEPTETTETWYKWYLPLFFGASGIVLLVMALKFVAGRRPSRQMHDTPLDLTETDHNPGDFSETVPHRVHPDHVKRMNDDQRVFLLRRLMPSLFSALFLTQCLSSDVIGHAFQQTHDGPFSALCDLSSDVTELAFLQTEKGVINRATGWLIPACSMPQIAGFGVLAGIVIYAFSWLCGIARSNKYDFGDFAAWIISGAAFGALMGVGFHFYLQIPDNPPAGNIPLVVAILDSDVMFLLFGVPWVLFAVWCADIVLIGFATRRFQFDADQEWIARSSGWLLVAMLAWLLLSFLILAGFLTKIDLLSASPIYWFLENGLLPLGVVAAIIIAIFGRGNPSEPAANAKGIRSILTNGAVSAAAPIFLGAMIFGLSIGLDFIVLGHRLFDAGLGSEYADILDKLRDGDPSPFVKFMGKLLLSCAAFFVIGIILSKSININRISLHTLYRNRLIRAFLGASSLARKPNLFTDFDTSDDLQMHDLRPEKSPIERTCWRPFLVLNLTLNMVSAKRLAWQERKAASFTVSPLHCGTGSKTYQTHPESGHTVDRPVGAYRYSAKYGHPRHGLSLGTAMAISGAAANPNMGYHSSPAITFIMTMLNLRLGWWLGNPAKEGQRTYNHEGPQNAIVPLFQETFGLTTDSKEYVHLSDGGHFDNLGLYEMVRRRCRFILVCDAGRDPTFGFEDLGNAVRKIFIDLGIPIRFNNLQTLKPRGREVDNSFAPKRAYHVIGEIDYQSIDPEGGIENGFILYIKPSYHGSESAAIRSYAMANQEFPHQTTANQWFTESQFEAYRSLGFEIMDEILMTSLKEPGSSAPRWKDICTQLKRAGVQQ